MSTQNVSLGGTFYHLDAPGWELYDGAAVTSESILPSDGRILLRQPTEVTDVATPGARGYRLDANEPNPFNPTTTIRFAVERAVPARLAVYDVAGRLVRVLLDAQLEPGEYPVEWDGRDDAGRDQASGVYFYRLSTPDFTQARRMTLVR
jgi:hypothetical protein